MNDPLDFDGKVVIVTGGTRGIGLAIARAFLGRGAEVIVCGRTEPDALPSHEGRKASFAVADVRDPEDVAALFDRIASEWRRADILVNNAGGSPQADAADASRRFSAKVVQLNLLGALHCSQAANRIMQNQKAGGVIVNIASVAGMRPSPGTAAYGAAKAGLINLTGSLAIEWAPKVRINAVSAGLILTEQAGEHYGDARSIERVAKTVPLGRLGAPGDVANACLFLASPLASYVTGANLLVHGGGETPAFLTATRGQSGS